MPEPIPVILLGRLAVDTRHRRFTAATGENDLVWLNSQQRGQLLTGMLDSLFCLIAI